MLKKLSMNAKVRSSFTAILVLLFVISLISYSNLSKLSINLHQISDKEIVKIKTIGKLSENMTRVRLFVAKHATEVDQAKKDSSEEFLNESIKQVKENIVTLRPLLKTDSNKQNLDEFEKQFNEYQKLIPLALTKSRELDLKGFADVFITMGPIGEKAVVELATLQSDIEKNEKKTTGETYKQIGTSKTMILIVSILAVLLSGVIIYLITRLISRSVAGVAKNVETTTKSVTEIKNSIDKTAIGAQELEGSMNKANVSVSELVASIQQVAVTTNGTATDVDEISAAVEQMSASINIVAESAGYLDTSAEETSAAIQEMMASIEQVAGNAENVEASVEQITLAIELISQSINGVSKNAINLHQTAEQSSETVEEMVVSIMKVADSAQTVNQLSNSVKNDALEGTVSLNETLNGMKEISHVINQTTDVMKNLGNSSEEIGSIIEVIDDIAEQTNLLALNAAIEAARAGEHGKGFAVVADEVRKLAERSAKATKEIAVLIKGIQNETAIALNSIKDGAQKVSVGNQLAEQTNQAINKISIGIAKVTEEMNQIAHATEEQRKNSEFITKVVENVTKQATEMTYSTKEQSITADEIVIGINNTKNQVQQISMATAEQAKGGRAIVEAVENVTTQASSVTNATREQSLTAEEIVNNIGNIKEMVRQMMIATSDQARYGEEIALEVGNVQKQTEELNNSIETQTNEVDEVVSAINNVNTQIVRLK
ncbi:methyl-accepting chemotaxis protein [Neobacillus sp. WH10]|uniref:HAMP domain-containing methyl-accepting chemotaxis protein n=1 Tax=Neobacillus sp. WH10 TaxID=3047873 RepID=UPI0024C1EE67|nr:methyl-accepting chemotaxis protein [Neobacillus sp. WH10]WHY79709.1 methyl-accepting chemotaxis protein [Neobacillus sp. WH10]